MLCMRIHTSCGTASTVSHVHKDAFVSPRTWIGDAGDCPATLSGRFATIRTDCWNEVGEKKIKAEVAAFWHTWSRVTRIGFSPRHWFVSSSIIFISLCFYSERSPCIYQFCLYLYIQILPYLSGPRIRDSVIFVFNLESNLALKILEINRKVKSYAKPRSSVHIHRPWWSC